MNKKPIIIDSDPGIDDALAIAVALFQEELDVLLITTVMGNATNPIVTHNLLCLLEYLDKASIPVAQGADSPLIRSFDSQPLHPMCDFEGFDFKVPTQCPLSIPAVDAMRQTILHSKEPVTLLAIGPLTNIALLLKLYPEVKDHLEQIILMGGSTGRGNKGIMSEFNIMMDPEAAHMVFHSGVSLVMVGLDVARNALLLPEDCEAIKAMNKTGFMIYSLFKQQQNDHFRDGLKMFDVTALAYLLRPDIFYALPAHVEIELHGSMTYGCTLVDLEHRFYQEENALVCVNIDQEQFRAWCKQALHQCV